MKRAIDTNVLISAHLPAMPEHQRVRAFLLAQLRSPSNTMIVTPNILHEFVHVITDAKRFTPPVAIVEALAIARLYLDRSNVECLAPDEADLRAAFDLMERHRLGRKRVADTLLAATLLRHGIAEIITCNPRDFEVFQTLRIVDPRAA